MLKNLLIVLIFFFSGLVFFTGAALVVMYILNGVIKRIGQADQSLIFWYLPILFMGMILMAIGWALGAWGWDRLRKLRSPGDL